MQQIWECYSLLATSKTENKNLFAKKLQTQFLEIIQLAIFFFQLYDTAAVLLKDFFKS